MAKIWFFQNWMYAGLIAGLFLLAVLPLIAGEWSAAMVAVFLMLPAYMIHQVEEHAGDRFRRFVNKHIARVPNALTTPAVVVVNVPLVWGVDLVAICRDAGKRVDAWTYTLSDPGSGFSDREWLEFSRLLELGADQITTDEPLATERAFEARSRRG